MKDEQPANGKSKSRVSSAKPLENSAQVPATDEPATANKLTPEEQMAAFEKDLKENDWGHQPC